MTGDLLPFWSLHHGIFSSIRIEIAEVFAALVNFVNYGAIKEVIPAVQVESEGTGRKGSLAPNIIL